ncbi:MAG: homoserine O-acetyltransferase [Acidobacteria bacterium]|jgi:homoserine O-acetyltransferase|nr:homoserine O-acetyltransferase [Acidobacteriota bacterium]
MSDPAVDPLAPPPAPPGARLFQEPSPYRTVSGAELPGFELAYETWGTLAPDKDNAILLCTGLSASSHARSHSADPAPGWWERMVGEGAALDTRRYFVVCTNVLGGCFGSTGPASPCPADGRPWGLRFPVVTIQDMARAQARLLEHLGIERLHAVVGSSMGGMQALAFGALFPSRAARVAAISAPGRAYPLSIALRFVQRQAVMRDPQWQSGRYEPGRGPREGLRLAREIGTISYRSGPEWDQRFGRERLRPAPTDVGPDFQVEAYLVRQGERLAESGFDPNSFLYLSKAMDLFDLGQDAASYEDGIARIHARTLVVGVTTDLLFPIHQQEELARILREAGREARFVRLDSVYGHDAFLIDVERFAAILQPFLDEPAPRRGPRHAG